MLVESTELGELSTFKDFVKPGEKVNIRNLVHNIVCDEDGVSCRLSSKKHRAFNCADCKTKEEAFKEAMLGKYHTEGIQVVKPVQWDFRNQRQRETLEMPVEEFVDVFLEELNLYKSHSHMTTKQFDKFDDLKMNLPKGEAVVWMDYAGKISF